MKILKMKKTALSGILFIFALLILSSCGSRRVAVRPSPASAARIADAMSHLHSKQLYRFITEWTGVKYRFGGLDKNGIDCSGFALLLQKNIYGRELPRISRDQAQTIIEKDVRQLNEGDLLFFSFGRRRCRPCRRLPE